MAMDLESVRFLPAEPIDGPRVDETRFRVLDHPSNALRAGNRVITNRRQNDELSRFPVSPSSPVLFPSSSTTSQAVTSRTWCPNRNSSNSIDCHRSSQQLVTSQNSQTQCNPNHTHSSFPNYALPLPSRSMINSRWRNLFYGRFSSLWSRRGPSEHPARSTVDRVVYQPATNEDDHSSVNIRTRQTISSTTFEPNEGPLYCTIRKCLFRIAILIFILILTVIIYQTFHLLSNKCEDSLSKSRLSPSFSIFHPMNTNTSTAKMNPSEPPYSSSTSSNLVSETSTNEVQTMFETCYDTKGDLFPWHDIRLPSFILPLHYELFMSPDMNTFFNSGNVSILLRLQPNHTSRFVVVHSKKLDIHSVHLFRVNQLNLSQVIEESELEIENTKECVKLEQLYIEAKQNLTWHQHYRVVVEFSRQLEDQLEGFYVSTYYNTEKNQRHYLLTTHFEPTLARTAFPCFDEPAMKASFTLKMVHDEAYQVYFNTEKLYENVIEVNGSAKHLTVFEQTVPMSTYLVAFVLCDFSVVETQSQDGVRIRALVPVNQDANTQYALLAASKILTYYENFFKIPYPLRKLDLVAVPDFGAGAMENWGLITFRTTTLLYNDKESSSEMQEQVATVISHEIAHQWFGNLVTMDWWNDLWLNEGFASFVENLGVDYVHPEWRMLDQFVISTTQHALAMDSLLSSHSINTTVTNPAEIEAIFDMISYKKGSCLVRMIENFLGLENLQLGLKTYLNRYKYKTAKTSQLWECFSEVSSYLPFNVSAIMDTWILQQGYPLISAKWDKDNKHIVITQHIFVSSLGPDEFQAQQANLSLYQSWIVPLTLVNDYPNQSKLYWLNSTTTRIPLDRDQNEWFKLNFHQSGFYRVNYETSVWRDLVRQLVNANPNKHVLSASDRAGLIDDALSLMRIGYLDVNTAMDLTRYLEFGEHDYVPWETILNHFGIIDSLMLQHPMLHRYIRRLTRSLVNRLAWDERPEDGMFEKKLRAIILRAAVFYGDKQSINKALQYFKLWMHHGQNIPANIRDIVYHAGAQFGTDAEWYYCWNKYLNTTVPSEKRLLLGVLGSTRNLYLLSLYLSASLNRTLVRTQDTSFVIQYVSRNPVGRDLAWKFVRTNWDYILSVFGHGSFALDSIVSETTWHFYTEFEYQEVKNFFNSVNVGSGKQAVKQSLEKIRANIYWKKNVEPRVIRWLSKVSSEAADY